MSALHFRDLETKLEDYAEIAQDLDQFGLSSDVEIRHLFWLSKDILASLEFAQTVTCFDSEIIKEAITRYQNLSDVIVTKLGKTPRIAPTKSLFPRVESANFIMLLAPPYVEFYKYISALFIYISLSSDKTNANELSAVATICRRSTQEKGIRLLPENVDSLVEILSESKSMPDLLKRIDIALVMLKNKQLKGVFPQKVIKFQELLLKILQLAKVKPTRKKSSRSLGDSDHRSSPLRDIKFDEGIELTHAAKLPASESLAVTDAEYADHIYDLVSAKVNESDVISGSTAQLNLTERRSTRWINREESLVALSTSEFNRIEVSHLVDGIYRLLESVDDEERQSALLLLLSIFTGIPAHKTVHWIIGQEIDVCGNYTKIFSDVSQVSINEGLRHSTPTSMIHLALPNEVVRFLPLFRFVEGQSISKAFSWSEDEARSACKHALKIIRTPQFQRIKYPRLHLQLKIRLLSSTKDYALAYLMLGNDNEIKPVQLYYRSINACDVQQAYDYVVAELLHRAPLSRVKNEVISCQNSFGSQYVVDPSAVKGAIKPVLNKISKRVNRKKLDELIQFHNVYSAYTLLFGMFATTHRPTIEPFTFLSDMDLANGIVCVNDKLSTALHHNRLSITGGLAAAQFNNYVDHLRGLAASLVKAGHLGSTAGKIISVVSSQGVPDKQALPFMFFLDENCKLVKYSHALLIEMLAVDWPFPNNIHRHIFENQMHLRGVPAEYTDFQMGHMLIATHPLSTQKSWSLSDISRILTPAVDSLIEELGFKPLKGLDAGHKQVNIKPIHRADNEKVFHQARRKDNAKAIQRLFRRSIKQFIKSAHKKFPEEQGVGNKKQRWIREQINLCFDMEPRFLNHAHRTFTRYIEWLEGGGNNVYQTYSLPLVLPVQPVKDTWPCEFNKSYGVYAAFITYLNTKKNRPSLSRRWAEICVSACLSGAVFRYEWLDDLIINNVEGVVRLKLPSIEKDLIFFDLIKDEKYRTPQWRFYTDALTRGLLEGFYGIITDEKKVGELVESEIKSSFKSLVNSLGINARSFDKAVKELCRLSKAYWFYHLPRYQFSVLDGTYSNTPLPLSTMVRVHQHKYIEIPRDVIDGEIPILVGKHAGKGSLLGNTQFIKAVDEILKATKLLERQLLKGVELDAGHDVQGKISRRKMLKIAGDNILALMHDEHDPKINVITGGNEIRGYKLTGQAYKVATWIVFECDQRAASKGYALKISSLQRYFSAVKPLLDLKLNDIAQYSSEELVVIYQNMFDSAGDKNRKYRARVIRSCHDYLVKKFHVESVHWQELDVDWGTDIPAKANIITEAEYIKLHKRINHEFSGDGESKYLLSAAIFLGYRLGFRIGEVLNLLYVDLQDGQGVSFFQINSHLDDVLKSLYTQRQCFVIEELLECELECIKFLKNRIETFYLDTASIFNEVPVMLSQLDDFKKPIERQWITSTVKYLLMNVTGDPDVSFHHLRHSFANRIFRLIELEKDHQLMAPLKLTQYSNHAMDVVASRMGHTSSKTTIASYVHIIDEAIAKSTDAAELKGLNIDAVSYIRQQPTKTIIRFCKYKKISQKNGYAILSTYHKTQFIPEKQLKYIHKVESLRVSNNHETLELNLCQIDHILRMNVSQKPVASIAELFKLSVKEAESFLSIASSLEKATGFYFYGVNQLILDGWSHKEIKPYVKGFNSELNNFEALCQKIIELVKCLNVDDRKVLSDGMDIWQAAVNKKNYKNALVFEVPTQLLSFLNAIELLDFKVESFNATCIANTIDTPAMKMFLIDRGFKEECIKVESKGYACSPNMLLKFNGSSRLNYHLSFLRLLFICQIKLKIGL